MPERATPPPVDIIDDYLVIPRSFFSSSAGAVDEIGIVTGGKLS